tara:strand:+ start:27 stop:755 length:729 start_codon:yes stop_codon:yes gene_type:complete
MSIHIITYATHSGGSFNKLRHNLKHQGVELTILGWGEKWKGFQQKFEGVLNVINKYKPDDIIIFIDGFDTLPNKNFNIDKLKEEYIKNYEGKIIVSEEIRAQNNPILIYFQNKVFGGCINSGMYMGSAKDIEPFIKESLKMTTTTRCKGDDQCGMNMAAKNYNNLVVDSNKQFFNNIQSIEVDEENINRGFFTSRPGSGGAEPGIIRPGKLIKFINDYYKFFIPELIIILLIVTFMCYCLKK